MKEEDEAHLIGIYLTGPPGSGKTQLARQFAKTFRRDIQICNEYAPVVLTINVESIETILKSTKDLLQELKLVKTDILTKESDEIKVARLYMSELRKLLRRYPGNGCSF